MITASSGRAQYATGEQAPSRRNDGPLPAPAAPRRTTPPAAVPRRWQALWREAIDDVDELLRLLEVDAAATDALAAAATGFPLRVPRGFVARMRRGDPRDPLLLQVLSRRAELDELPAFGHDAVGDLAARIAPGVLQKYRGRALLVATGACAIHCRYCFRRHFPYASETAAVGGWRGAIESLRADPTISEVILSGGDPLALATARLDELTKALAGLPQVRRLRIHSRLPIVLPERVDDELLDWLRGLPWPVAFVVHANHANEIDATVASALAGLRAAGAMLLNQSVLLRDINDSVEALASLSERLFDCGVAPYYLHQLDRVSGTTHFEVDDVRAQGLVGALRGRLPGYLVPRLVREVPGETGKTPVDRC